jgi:predicted ATP-dependent protease
MKSNIETFSYLNALLVQFAKQNGYSFRIAHDVSDGKDNIYIGMKFPKQVTQSIDIDLNSEDFNDDAYKEICQKIMTYENGNI